MTNMKQISLFLFPVLLTGMALFSCQNNATEPKSGVNQTSKPDTVPFQPVPAEGAQTYTVNSGTVFWSAQRAIGSTHNGAINVSSGELQVNYGQLVGGRIVMDMPSIEVTNMDDRSEKATLESHLKDKDFFEVKKYPEATFKITEILPSTQAAFNWVIRGDLTIKDHTRPVNIPVRMSIAEDKLLAESTTFVINRTKWGINFRSGILGTAKDKMIQDVVSLSFTLEAIKK